MAVGVLFPGQGAQRAALGAPWRHHPAWSVVERAETVLGRPLAALLLDPEASLERTEDAQLAVLLASLMAWDSVAPTIDAPVAFAGHSLGQMTALIAAGVLGLDDGLRLAARRAAVTQAAADDRPGVMAALLGASLDQAEQACAGTEACWLANDNAPGQVIVAGTPDGVDAAVARARSLGVRRTTVLAVGGAFHTPLMAAAASAFTPDVEAVALSAPTAPVVSNGDARPYTDAEGWRSRMVDHLVTPLRWRQSIETMIDLGATELVEIGPGEILAGLARRTAPHVLVRSAGSPLQEVTCP